MYQQGTPISLGNIKIANVTSAPAAPPAPVNGNVTCSLHKKSRGIRFVATKPILNAMGETVGYTYMCTADSPCIVNGKPAAHPDAPTNNAADATSDADDNKSGSDDDFDVDGPSQSSNDGLPPKTTMKKLGYDGVRTTTTGSDAPIGGLLAATGGAVPSGLFSEGTPAAATATGGRFQVGAGNAAGRAPSRYYDMNKQGRDDDFKKVCWSCGMDSHEKPQCPNLLCRNCHDSQEPGYEGRMNHRCSRVGLSAFVLLDSDFLDNFMAAEEIKRLNASNGASSSSSSGAANDKAKPNPLLSFDEAAFVNPSLLTTRCPRCNQLGHMDCPHPLSAHFIRRNVANKKVSANNNEKAGEEADGIQRKLSCCGCASSDHSGYECPLRPRDYWRERVLNVAADQLGMEEVRRLIAIDERVPRGGPAGNTSNGGGGGSSYNTGGNNSYSSGGGGGGSSARPFGTNSAYSGNNNSSRGYDEPRPFGGNNVRSNTNNNRRRGRDDDSDGWSDDDRPARGGRRVENSAYNNGGRRGGRRGSSGYSDDSDFSFSDDDDSYRRGGNKGGRQGGGGGGGGGGRPFGGNSAPMPPRGNYSMPQQGRLDSRDHGRNTPSSPAYSVRVGGNTAQTYQRPAPQQHNNQSSYRAPARQQSCGNGGSSYNRPQPVASYQQQAQHQGGNGPRYSRPPLPLANSQPGRGAYSKRGFEF